MFRLLFSIDDFFRMITLTIILPVLANMLGFPSTVVLLALCVGLAMDVYDFAKEIGPGMSLSLNDFNLVYLYKNKKSLLSFIFALHDLIQIAAMTLLIPLFLNAVGLDPHYIVFGVILGIIIDVHDFTTEFGGGKVSIEED